MSRVMITGANGRIGQLLRPVLGDSVDWCQRAPSTTLGATLHWDPLRGADPLVSHARTHGAPAVLIQFARGLPGDPARDDAAIGRATLEAAKKAGIGRVLMASSSAVYGRSRAAQWREDEPVDPPAPYGQSKLAMERACSRTHWTQEGDIEITHLRIGNVAGADALLMNTRRPLLLDRFPDGHGPLRNYIGPATLARVLMALAAAPALPEILNLATPRPIDMAALAAAAGLPVEFRPAPETALAKVALDMTRLETLVPFADTDSDPTTMIAEWRASTDPR